MSKKAIAIIVGVVAAVAIIIVSVIGINARRENNIYVTGIDISNNFYEESVSDGIKTKTIHIDDEIMSYQIDGYVIPKDATNKEIMYTSNNEAVATVSETGLVTFTTNDSVNVLLESKDGGKKILVKLVRVAGTALTAFAVEIDSNGVNLAPAEGENVYSKKEGTTLVLYTGAEYHFNTDAQISIVGETAAATIENKTLSTTAAGTFNIKFNATVDGEAVEHTVAIKVVPYVKTFGYGISDTSFKAEIAKTTDSEFLGGYADKTLVAGKDSAFRFSIDTADNYGHAITSDIPLTYTAKKVIGTEETEVAIDTIATVNADYSLTFKAAAKGNTYKIYVSPLYDVAQRGALLFVVKVDDGVNVYTSDELAAAFADLNVSKIHLQSNIIASLKANQINADGTAKNMDTAANPNAGSVYKRYIAEQDARDVTTLQVEVNGNYYTVDGSALPQVSTADDEENFGSLSWADTAGYKIASVQISIFRIEDFRDVANADRLAAKFSNLKLTGNTAKGLIYKIDKDGHIIDVDDNTYTKLLAKQGSGFNGFIAEAAVVDFDNVSVSKCVINITAARQRSAAHLKNVYSFDAWGNGVYSWGGQELSLENTILTNFGGGAIAVEDPYETIATDEDWKDLIITIGKNVEIDNMCVGNEGWFVVNGYSAQLVPMLKASVDGGVQAMNKTMLKYTNEGTKFNFVYQMATAGELNDAMATTNFQVTFKIYVGEDDDHNPIYYTIERKNSANGLDHTFISENPIAGVLGGQYINALGNYANTEDFYKLMATAAIISNDVQNYTAEACAALIAEKTIDEFSYEFMCDSVGTAWNNYVTYITGGANLTLQNIVTALTANDNAAVAQGIQYLTLQATVTDDETGEVSFLRDIAFVEMNAFIEEGIEAIVGLLDQNGGYASKDVVKESMIAYNSAVGLIFDPIADVYNKVVTAGVQAEQRVTAVKNALLGHSELYVGLCQKANLLEMFDLSESEYNSLVQLALAASMTNGDSNALEIISAGAGRTLELIVTYGDYVDKHKYNDQNQWVDGEDFINDIDQDKDKSNDNDFVFRSTTDEEEAA